MNVLDKIRRLTDGEIRRSQIERRGAKYFGENFKEYFKIMLACDLSRDTHHRGKRLDGKSLISHERAMFIIAFDYLGIRDVSLLIAIFLHDMPEDYLDEWPFKRIERQFNLESSQLVWSVTKPTHEEYPNIDLYDKAIFEKVKNGGEKAIKLKCIDRLHNMITLNGTYKKRVRKVLQTIKFVLPLSAELNILTLELMIATTEQMCILGIGHN